MNKFPQIFMFALAITFVAATAHAGPIVYTVDTIDDQLHQLDVMTGVSTTIGNPGDVGFNDVEGLSFQPGTGVLFGLDDDSDQLITIDISTGIGSAVGSLIFGFSDAGLAFASDGSLYGSTDLCDNGFYSINTNTGAATLVSSLISNDAHALAFYNNTMYGILDAGNKLYSIDLITGLETLIGALGIDTDEEGFII